jgi:hypothetical protein
VIAALAIDRQITMGANGFGDGTESRKTRENAQNNFYYIIKTINFALATPFN